MKPIFFRGAGLAGALLLTISPSLLIAGETVTYTYDAKGRLVKVEHAGTVNDNVKTEYEHDKADNRTNVKTTRA